jgi:hypothetical protein
MSSTWASVVAAVRAIAVPDACGTGGGAGVDQEVVPRGSGGGVRIQRVGIDVLGQNAEAFVAGTDQGGRRVLTSSVVMSPGQPSHG